jgi:hypothetical protein
MCSNERAGEAACVPAGYDAGMLLSGEEITFAAAGKAAFRLG